MLPVGKIWVNADLALKALQMAVVLSQSCHIALVVCSRDGT